MLLPWKNLFNKKKEKTMNTEKLISLKENFTGQKFQWIKTDRPELLGKVVTCRDINPSNNGGFTATFDDGSKIDASKLNSNLLMIHGDMPPLSKAEVEAINGPIRPLANKVNATVIPNDVPPSARPIAQPVGQPVPAQASSQTNMFANFNSEETQFALTLNVKLPDRKLLKLMYANAGNKDKFLSELSEYLHSTITKNTIKESVESILAPSQIKKEARPVINFKEVDESR